MGGSLSSPNSRLVHQNVCVKVASVILFPNDPNIQSRLRATISGQQGLLQGLLVFTDPAPLSSMGHGKTPILAARGTRHRLPSTLLLRTGNQILLSREISPGPTPGLHGQSCSEGEHIFLSSFFLKAIWQPTRESLPAQPTCVWNVAERESSGLSRGVGVFIPTWALGQSWWQG